MSECFRGWGIIFLLALAAFVARPAGNAAVPLPGSGPGAIFVGLELPANINSDERGQLSAGIHEGLDAPIKVLVFDLKQEATGQRNFLQMAHSERAATAVVLRITKTGENLTASALIYMPREASVAQGSKTVIGRSTRAFGFQPSVTNLGMVPSAEPQFEETSDWKKPLEIAFVIEKAASIFEAGKRAATWLNSEVIQPLFKGLIPIHLEVMTNPGGAGIFLCKSACQQKVEESLGNSPEGESGLREYTFLRERGSYELLVQKLGYSHISRHISVVEGGQSYFSFNIMLVKEPGH